MKSGAGRKAAVGERGERLWVGEPGRLSPEDSEWFRDEKLRLVCRRGEGCMAKRLKRERRLEHTHHRTSDTWAVPPHDTRWH